MVELIDNDPIPPPVGSTGTVVSVSHPGTGSEQVDVGWDDDPHASYSPIRWLLPGDLRCAEPVLPGDPDYEPPVARQEPLVPRTPHGLGRAAGFGWFG